MTANKILVYKYRFRYSQQRSEFAAELEVELRRLAPEQEPVTESPGVSEPAEATDEGSVISHCEEGEDRVLRMYQEALTPGLPAELRAMVERQLLKIKEAHDQVSSLHRVHSRYA